MIFSDGNVLGKIEQRVRGTKTKTRLAALLLLGFAVFLALGADSCSSSAPVSQQQTDQQNNNSAASKLHQANPYPQLTNSNELRNETQRYHALNDDPNRVSYIYLMGTGGQIVAEYQIKGKVSSTDSLYSAPVSTDCSDGSGVVQGSGAATCAVVPAAQPDGSYGQNEPGVYFFINDAGHTMVEWNGTYLWSLNQINLQQPPEIVIVPNGK